MYKYYDYVGNKEDYDNVVSVLKKAKEVDTKKKFRIAILDIGQAVFRRNDNGDEYTMQDIGDKVIFKASIYPIDDKIKLTPEQFICAVQNIVCDEYKVIINVDPFDNIYLEG